MAGLETMAGFGRLVIFLIGAALLARFGIAEAAAQAIRIGVVLPYTGPLAGIGSQIERGLSLYLKEHERELPGTSFQIIRRDDQGRPEAAAQAAQELTSRDRADVVVGGATGASAAAIAQVTQRTQTPFIALYAASNEITRSSPYVIRMSIAASQTSYAIGAWSARQGAKSGFVLVSDSSYGRDAELAFAAGFREGGGNVLGVERVALGSEVDFVSPLLKMKAARPNVVFAFLLSGPPSRAFLRRYYELGFAREGIRLVGPQDLAADNVIADMGEEIRGLTTAGSYSSEAERPQNRAFVDAWMRAYSDKTPPDFMAVAAWDGMAAIFDLTRQTKGRFSGDQALDFLKQWKNPGSPRGPISIDPATREAIQDIYIRRVEIRNGRAVNVELETVPYRRGLLNLN